MKRYSMLGAALVALTMAGTSFAAPAIDWDPAYYYEAGATFSSSTPGNELRIVGLVSAFGPPFSDLDANDPTKEYTFLVSGLISNGTTTVGSPGLQFYTTTYTGGTITLYEGTPRNSVFDPSPPNANVPSTFVDGTVLLTGIISNFFTQANDFTTFQVGNSEGVITWTGGSLFSRVSAGGFPCPSLFTGGMTWRPSVMIAGYLFRHDGKIDVDCPTSARSSTWGSIKSLYR
ncbi:MAG: hypothetical protein HOP12_13295 [Candidatus Eisenbacteria bacterium]|uniref:PEP-CTERM sorting domain-containing protein n=1 Tax=Eiseniibacteriota bacterium TaxID=2212470 RepID=A0A849SQB7_UNCEI|nr:hypothetical protein [Candidatus Eisenbacteria bacterium]